MKFDMNIRIQIAFLLLFAVASCKKNDEPSFPDASVPPSLKLNNEIIITTLGAEFFMEADLKDSVGLKSFTLRYDDWYLFNVVPLSDSGYPKSYHVKYKFRMPDTAANKIHSITMTATNVGNKETSAQYKVTLNTDFPKMYLVEESNLSNLTADMFGVPALVNKKGSYSYEADHYSAVSGTKIYFLPGKTAIKPIMYGADPVNGQALTGDYSKAKPIVLPGVGYFRIRFNTLDLSYAVTPIATPDPARAPLQVSIVGRGFTDYPDMNWQNALPNIILLDKSISNPYLFNKNVKVSIPAGANYNTTQFILTSNNGWSLPFWRFDNGKDPEATVLDGGENVDIAITNTPVTYKVTFDAYLNRCKFERQ